VNKSANRFSSRKARGYLYGGIIVAFLLLFLILCQFADDHWRSWIELLNGATWPENLAPDSGIHRAAFYLIVSLRIFLNLSTLIAGGIVVAELLIRRKENVMKVSDMLHSRHKYVMDATDRALALDDAQKKTLREVANRAAHNWDKKFFPAGVGDDIAEAALNVEVVPEEAQEAADVKISSTRSGQ
jgi:hypothetical protein